MAIVLKIAKKETSPKFKPESVTNVDPKSIIWNNATHKKKELLLLSVLSARKWVICLETVHKLPMGSSIKEEVVTFVDQTNIRNSTVQREDKNSHSMSLISKIFKNIFILKFKMEKRFDKTKLGVIHPIMDKKPFEKDKQFLEERFLLKGE
jgi:hypothetical protein